MQSGVFAVIFLVLNLSAGVLGEDVIKRGTFRFMAYLYYQDETVVDGTGARFLQAGVLIRANFLISSALVSSVSEDPLSKTLLARLGAVHIDANFTLNEDEDEQEQEVIQIIVPHEHNHTHWWASDISLLKTLQPFLKTSAVQVTQLSTGRDFSDKNCNILVFKKNLASAVDGLFLTQLSVEMLPVSIENCGDQFNENTMTCATDPPLLSEEKAVTDFCQGNSGGPLICDNDVMALQTYINGNCNPPHLYQLLAPWRNFLSCGTEDNCNNREKCSDVCTVTFKDAPPATETVINTTTIILTEATSTEIVISRSEDKNVSDASPETVTPQFMEEYIVNITTEEPPTTINTTTTVSTTTTTTTTTTEAEVTNTETPTPTPTQTSKETESSWPHEREVVKKIHDIEDIKVETVRDHKIEAQQHKTKLVRNVRNVGDKNTSVVHGLIYSVFFMWLCLV
ncbi:uncharacterized protein [Choristoneura fumiferana]|uniref:uncharacterized protein n=1 Tax=Choristoneura fumiferana TaxID=7141 RepID=UPI003D15573C